MHANASSRVCDHPGCREPGTYRAPQARQALDSFYWFCLEHVRAYNRSWNYCAGMNTEEIEANIRSDAVWRRPTWRFGTGGRRIWSEEELDDSLGILGRRKRPAHTGSSGNDGNAARRYWSPSSPEGKALATMGLEGTVTLQALKMRYKELAKKHHPDANGGCKLAEERLKSINEAYAVLRKTITA